MEYKNYYKILGVSQFADLKEIKKSYRTLAMKYHPDRNAGDKRAEEKFKEIAEAYDVLSDAEKRRKFDELSAGRETSHNSGNYQSADSKKQSANEDNFDDLYNDFKYYSSEEEKTSSFSEFFKQFFSKSSKKTAEYYSNMFKGEDVRGKITIDLEEAYVGSERTLTINNQKLRLKLKPGVTNDQLLKIKGKGREGSYGSEAGDLYVRIVIRRHPIFARKGDNLYTTVPVDIYTIIIGGKVNVKTFKGDVSINIPAGTKTGKKLRLKGLGMPNYENPEVYGDLFVIIKHEISENVDPKDRELIEKLREKYKHTKI